MRCDKATLTRKELAVMLQVTDRTIRKREKTVDGLKRSRVPAGRSVRYSVYELRKERWFRMIEGDSP